MKPARIGVYGMGTMGRALAFNLADHGFDVAIANREADWLADTLGEAGALSPRLTAKATLEAFVAGIAPPRLMLFMIPSGAPMDEMIGRIRPLLVAGDVLIDGGNADFHATRRRAAALAPDAVQYVGMGVSGGAEGARWGPSLMVGCKAEVWPRLSPLLTAIAARHGDDPCAARVGPSEAGHFVKTVHNGIEYADMQMIAEIYGVLRDGAGWEAPRIASLFDSWSTGPLASFLVETTARVLAHTDPVTGRPLVDLILDSAGQKGTGRWSVIEALHLGQSANTIEAAVAARNWSSDKPAREAAAELRVAPAPMRDLPPPETLAEALLAGRLLSHAQGFALLGAADEAHGWNMDLARIAEIWRAGCIIRSALLDDLARALRAPLPHGHLILEPSIAARIRAAVPALRRLVVTATGTGIPVPALSAALAWYDSMGTARGTSNLIQAQRDSFGAHGFRRIDAPGDHHGDWG